MTNDLDIWESDLRHAGYDWVCCESCHDDMDLGYDATFRLGPEDSQMHCCCTTPRIEDDAEWRRIRSLRTGAP